jgi:hypothetical protein
MLARECNMTVKIEPEGETIVVLAQSLASAPTALAAVNQT